MNGPPKPSLTADVDVESSQRIATIFQVFKACQNGHPPRCLDTLVYKLNTEGDKDLRRRLNNDAELWGYVDDKVRYDYDPIGSKLIIRTNSTLHPTELGGDQKRLEDLAKNQIEKRPLVDKVCSVDGTIYFEDER